MDKQSMSSETDLEINPRTIGCAWNSDALTSPVEQTAEPSGSFARFSGLSPTVGWPNHRVTCVHSFGEHKMFFEGNFATQRL
jgi:hypothetical protein